MQKAPPLSMELTLYATKSAPNAIDKEFDADTPAKTVTGTLRERTSLIDPVLWVKADARGYNYARIEQFGRWYFIDSIQSVSNGLWEVRLHVDVLKTYANQIRALQATRTRGATVDPLSDAADYPISAKSTARWFDFPYTFKESDKMVLVAVIGA